MDDAVGFVNVVPDDCSEDVTDGCVLVGVCCGSVKYMFTATSTSLLERCSKLSMVWLGMSPRIAFREAMEAWSLGRLLDMVIKLQIYLFHTNLQFFF